MKISYANGQSSREVENLDEATVILTRQYGDDVVIHDEWEPANFDGSRERRLVWATEADADNDAGQNAVAEIIRDNA